MARKSELDPSIQTVKVNMTPMIDCTFLLLIFFMVVSEMSSLSMEDVALPHASEANIGEPVSPMLTVNIRKDDAERGVVHVMGRAYDRNKLSELVRREAIKSSREHDPRYPSIPTYKLNVLVRCDRDAKYETVQWVFDACSRNGVYRTTLAASPSE